jgi:hypothetical protein
VQGDNPRTASVVAGAGSGVSFTVTCTAPPSNAGTLRVITATTGSNVDPDGYIFAVDGGAPQPVGANATLALEGLPPGPHAVRLSGLATNCHLAGENPRTVTVTAGSTGTVAFTVTCQTPALRWQQMTSGTTSHLYGVWGSGPADVYAVGAAGGSWKGAIIHYDGHAWSQVYSDPDHDLHGIWGSGPNDIYAVTGSGPTPKDDVIRHYDGQAWSSITPALGVMQPFLLSVWGASKTDVFAVGEHFDGSDRTLIAHYNGSAWSKMPWDGRGLLQDVHGTSAQDVYAVGYNFPLTGTIVLHYDGSQWALALFRKTGLLFGIWANSPSDVFAVGWEDPTGGFILHYDGLTWSQMDIPAVKSLGSIWGTSGSDIYAVGDAILHYDGHSWTQVSNQGGARVWGSSPTDVFVVGANGSILHGTP